MNVLTRTSRATVPGILVLCLAGILPAEDLLPADEDLFENHARPVLVRHCIRCHGPTKQESGLRLTSREAMVTGGDSGSAIDSDDPTASLLLEAIRYESLEMPPDSPLTPQQIAGIEQWLQAGAPWPAGTILRPGPHISADDREWWCYQPIADPPLPQTDDDTWTRNEIDRFVLARLQSEQITPSTAASRATLARRLSFAVTGLPPDETAQGYVNGDEDYESLVDRLLQSADYGENQARFWLDLVRYADSDGYRADHARPEAKHYRDYVIRSFNDDKPYDRFVTEQLAGDEIDPGNRDALIATMFLRHWIYEHNQRDVEQQWSEILSDITETTADAFLAQGVRCARCHDHKFDPILQKDYYRLKAFFAAIQPTEDLQLADVAQHAAWQKQQAAWLAATDDLRRELHDIETPVLLENSGKEGFDKFVPEIKSMMLSRATDRTPYEQQIACLALRQLEQFPEKLPDQLDAATEARRQELRQQLAGFDSLKPGPLPTLKFVATDVGPVAPVTLVPGDSTQTPIEPGFLSVLDDQPAQITPPDPVLQSTGRRTALARWITDRSNPLTARVIVNRIWQQHFGRGLVETTSDFGHLGKPPTHPELLDWLASRFMEDGWSIKQLHRRILTSATWRQASRRTADEKLSTLDPANTLYWRMNPRRLSGEEIHDTMLAASGELAAQKRAIYKPVLRNKQDPLLALFDFPDRIRSTGERHRTTTSPQALMLMNNTWTHARATAMAQELSAANDDEFIISAWQRLYYRRPDAAELSDSRQFLTGYASITPKVEATPLVTNDPAGLPALDFRKDSDITAQIPWSEQLPNGDFTVEAVVTLRSLYPDAKVRTIAAHWNGNSKHVGWSLGVTSAKSAYKPRNLILQLIGSNSDGQRKYEVIASNLRLELNRPYHVRVAVRLQDTSTNGVVFTVHDRSQPDSAPKTTQVAHSVVSDIRPKHTLGIGGRPSHHRWDGWIRNLRVYQQALTGEESAEAMKAALICDHPLTDDTDPGIDVSSYRQHANIASSAKPPQSPREQAAIAFLHTLMNSSELIYVD